MSSSISCWGWWNALYWYGATIVSSVVALVGAAFTVLAVVIVALVGPLVGTVIGSTIVSMRGTLVVIATLVIVVVRGWWPTGCWCGSPGHESEHCNLVLGCGDGCA